MLIILDNGKFLIVKGRIKMVDMYSRLVKAGLRTIQKVPDQFRDDVMTNLTMAKSDGNGNSIPTTNISNIIVDR
ncbi:CD1375 family protein [uncultured Clostridium sp.]|uniref:CD1375 family protein n=2 Tax=Clostridium TaxID=1485 RepID=UPI0026158C66|nr:CD1375 family protein [uncultured Clostridium sp.]